MVVSCQSWHLDVFLPLLAWDDLNVSSFSYFQEHSEYSLAHLDEMMLLLHGMKSALDSTVLESQLLCYQHLLVHMIKVGWQLVFFPQLIIMWLVSRALLWEGLCFTGALFETIMGFLCTIMQSRSLFFLAYSYIYACRLCLYCYISVMSTQKYKNK